MKFDDVIAELGEFGSYQKRIYYLVCLAAIPCALQALNIVFTMASQSHRCVIPGLSNDTYKSEGSWHDDLIKSWVPWDNDEDEYSSCKLFVEDPNGMVLNKTKSCSDYVYDTSVFDTTIFSEVEMVCEDKSLKTYANMIYMGGLLVGSLVMGSLADIIGRKKVIVISVFGHFGVCLAIAFTHTYAPFVVLRFCAAFFGMGMFLPAFVIGMEIVGPSKRKFAGIVIEMFWVLGLFLLALFAYFIREWKYLSIACAIPTVFLFSYAFLLPESPRWLINKKRFDEAREVIERAAKGNNVTLSEKAARLDMLDNEGADEKIWLIFTDRTLAVRSIIVFLNWTIASMVYYGLSLNVGGLSGDIHLNYTLSSLVEGASYVFCLVFLDRVGRKPLQCFTMLLAGIACLGTMFPVMYGGDDVKWVTVVLSLIGKFGASAAFAIIYIYSAELFPTPMRNSGMGVSSFSARVGGIAAPYIADLGDHVDGNMGVALPLIIFGGASIAVGLLALFLPETTNRILPDSVQDAKNFGKEPRKNTYALGEVAGESGSYRTGKDNPSFGM